MASLNLRLHTAGKLLERDRQRAVDEIAELAELAQANIQDIRRLIYDLRPAVLDELGLVPALRDYAGRWGREQGVELVASLPDGSERLPPPLETALFLHCEMPHLGIVFCTMFEDDESVLAGLKAGGRGYILKDADPNTMLRAVRAVAHGESLLSPAVANKVVRQFAALPGEAPVGRASLCDDLTEREREVLVLIGQGHSNREIANQLCHFVRTRPDALTGGWS